MDSDGLDAPDSDPEEAGSTVVDDPESDPSTGTWEDSVDEAVSTGVEDPDSDPADSEVLGDPDPALTVGAESVVAADSVEDAPDSDPVPGA